MPLVCRTVCICAVLQAYLKFSLAQMTLNTLAPQDNEQKTHPATTAQSPVHSTYLTIEVKAAESSTIIAQKYAVRIQHGDDDESDVFAKLFGNGVVADDQFYQAMAHI